MKYRPDIDGLRAIAVLSVLAFHYGAALPAEWRLDGGFIGVDVFFVISGFLITSTLAEDIAKGRFSILGFYDRRVRRIVPALIVMLAATLMAANALLLAGDYQTTALSAASAAFGVSNIFFMGNTGYFDQSSDLMPLLHTWSLGVEEQFYLFWPILLFVVMRGRSQNDITAIITTLIIVGFGISLISIDHDSKFAFYSALPRAWELAIGGLLPFLRPLNRRLGELAGVSGLALISYGFFMASVSGFPGFQALYPCLGAALVIWPRAQTTTAKYLGFLAPVGLISYSLYLWHWPIWVMYRFYINSAVPTGIEALLLATASIAVAIASFYCVERPFRRKHFTPATAIKATVCAALSIFCWTMFIDSKGGLPERTPDALALQSLSVMWDWPCQSLPLDSRLPPLCTFGPGDSVSALLWGDSNSEHFAPMIQVAARNAGVSVALTPNCSPVIDGKQMTYRAADSYNASCAELNYNILKVLAERPQITTVILSGSWKAFIDLLPGTEKEVRFERALLDLVNHLTTLGKRVVLIETIPQWSIPDPIPCATLDVGLWRRQCDAQERTIRSDDHARNNLEATKIIRRLKDRFPNVLIIDPSASMCAGEFCINRVNNEFLYRDSAHFRRNLSQKTNEELARDIGLDRIFAP